MSMTIRVVGLLVATLGVHLTVTTGCGGGAEPTVSTTDSQAEASVPAANVVQKVNHMRFGSGGHPGQALNVDGLSWTCAPANNCSQGRDNQLAGLMNQLASLADPNEAFSDGISKGDLILVARAYGWNTTGEPFGLGLYIGTAEDDECDLVTEVCSYSIEGLSRTDPSQRAIVYFDNAVVRGNLLTAGGDAYHLTADLHLLKDAPPLALTMHRCGLEARVEGEADSMVWVDGVLGGAIRLADIDAWVDSLPPTLELPVSNQLMKNLLSTWILPDIDTGMEGILDAASVGLVFSTLSAHVY